MKDEVKLVGVGGNGCRGQGEEETGDWLWPGPTGTAQRKGGSMPRVEIRCPSAFSRSEACPFGYV